MNLIRYKSVSEYDVKKHLEKGMEFSDYQKEKLIDVIRDLPFQFVSFDKPEKSNPLFRLTAIFYLLYVFLLIVSMPFKWLITGNYSYKFDGVFIRLVKNWKKKLIG